MDFKWRLAGATSAILVVLLSTSCNGRSATPTPATVPPASPAAQATATPVVATPSPTAGSAAQFDAQFLQIESKVESLRELQTESITRRQIVDQATIAARVARELEEEDSKESIAKEQRLYRLLGLIPMDADLTTLYRELLGSQVLGLYDPESEEFLVLGKEGPLSALAESTYVHEFTHRLQDVHFDLDALSEEAGDNGDRLLALSALIEGDAVVTQVGYGLRHMGQDRLAELLNTQGEFAPPPADTPRILIESIEFPYETGPQFVAALRAKGGFARVNDAFKDPPTSSEQVMHASKYEAREPAKPVSVGDLSAALGDGWSLFATDVLGEFFLRAWLETMGVFTATRAAGGWGGDQYVLFDGPGGGSAMAARIVWDDPETDAQEFFEGLVSGLDRSDLKRSGAASGARNRVAWEGPRRAIGIELLAEGRGLAIAAAADRQHVLALLDRLAKP